MENCPRDQGSHIPSLVEMEFAPVDIIPMDLDVAPPKGDASPLTTTLSLEERVSPVVGGMLAVITSGAVDHMDMDKPGGNHPENEDSPMLDDSLRGQVTSRPLPAEMMNAAVDTHSVNTVPMDVDWPQTLVEAEPDCDVVGEVWKTRDAETDTDTMDVDDPGPDEAMEIDAS